MRRIYTFIAAIVAVLCMSAQTLNIKVGQVIYAVPAIQAGEMVYENGSNLTVMGKTLSLADITGMYVDATEVVDNMVSVNYNGTSATITVAGNVARYIEPSVTGAEVSIVQSAEVSELTCGEITYRLTGASDNGLFHMEGSYKSTVELADLSLACTTGAPIDIQNGKRIVLSSKNGTVNALSDCSGGTQKGCIVCKGHLELKGKGTLNVSGNTAHAIYAKEYIEMKNVTVNVLKAVKDGVNCNQYFTMESGTLNISGVGDDGLQVSFKDDVDREPEDTGSITISGGDIKVSVTAVAAKGIKADGDVTVTGGNIEISTSGSGKWDAADVKTKASTCISADGNMAVKGGTFNLTSSGGGGKGISCDGDLTVDAGTITVTTTGGMFAYVNGTTNDNYTGNTDNLASDYKSSPKGIKADGNVTINGGFFNIKTTGNGAEGIESKSVLTVNDGTIVINARDDCMNSSSHMYINGGDITVIATGNDALDSNGNMYIAGGVIRAFGAGAPECGLDANEEEGYSVVFTGGMVLAVGGGNSVPSTDASTQAYVTGSGSVTAGQTVSVGNGTTTLATFTVPADYTGSTQGGGNRPFAAPGGGGPGGGPGGGGPGGGPGGQGGGILITCPGLVSGSSYTLTVGTTTSTVTAALKGSSGGFRP